MKDNKEEIIDSNLIAPIYGEDLPVGTAKDYNFILATNKTQEGEDRNMATLNLTSIINTLRKDIIAEVSHMEHLNNSFKIFTSDTSKEIFHRGERVILIPQIPENPGYTVTFFGKLEVELNWDSSWQTVRVVPLEITIIKDFTGVDLFTNLYEHLNKEVIVIGNPSVVEFYETLTFSSATRETYTRVFLNGYVEAKSNMKGTVIKQYNYYFFYQTGEFIVKINNILNYSVGWKNINNTSKGGLLPEEVLQYDLVFHEVVASPTHTRQQINIFYHYFPGTMTEAQSRTNGRLITGDPITLVSSISGYCKKDLLAVYSPLPTDPRVTSYYSNPFSTSSSSVSDISSTLTKTPQEYYDTLLLLNDYPLMESEIKALPGQIKNTTLLLPAWNYVSKATLKEANDYIATLTSVQQSDDLLYHVKNLRKRYLIEQYDFFTEAGDTANATRVKLELEAAGIKV